LSEIVFDFAAYSRSPLVELTVGIAKSSIWRICLVDHCGVTRLTDVTIWQPSWKILKQAFAKVRQDPAT
jgi:hypothetical protein